VAAERTASQDTCRDAAGLVQYYDEPPQPKPRKKKKVVKKTGNCFSQILLQFLLNSLITIFPAHPLISAALRPSETYRFLI